MDPVSIGALLGTGAVAIGTRLAYKLAGQKFLEWAFFKIAKGIVNHTKTPHDDEWYEKIEEAYYGEEKSDAGK